MHAQTPIHTYVAQPRIMSCNELCVCVCVCVCVCGEGLPSKLCQNLGEGGMLLQENFESLGVNVLNLVKFLL